VVSECRMFTSSKINLLSVEERIGFNNVSIGSTPFEIASNLPFVRDAIPLL
jgi:hypothetical protein